MILFTEKLELRGVKNCSSKNGKNYLVLNCENVSNGDAYQFYCPTKEIMPTGLNKGDKVELKLEYNTYKNLLVREVKKVS